jgi:hypothetical protein
MRRKLEHTVIYRGGQISGNHFEVTRECHASVEKGGIFVRNSLTFEFEIPSGGGFSTITLEVGRRIFQRSLKKSPEQCQSWPLFSLNVQLSLFVLKQETQRNAV